MEVTEQEFVNIIEDNNRPLMHLCRSYTNQSDERKDMYQEIIVQIWQSLPDFKGDAKLSTWVYRIGVNTAISFIRKKNTRREYHQAYRNEQPNSAKHHNHIEDDNEQVDELYEAISTLNASEKAIINMYLEDFTYAEISYVTDITENYVGVKLNRIKKKLSTILGE